MPLTNTGDIVAPASTHGNGVGAFNVIQIEHAEAFVTGAEQAAMPVILQISENTAAYHGAIQPILAACLAIAGTAAVPVAVHLDHATQPDLVVEAVEHGVGSVMYDASVLPYEENVAATAKIASYCHEHGVWVEAELGEVGGKDGVHAPGARTDPAEARRFVAATGVDALAVAVGTSHAMVTRDAVLDFELIGRLHREVPVPLVLHGSSGVSDGDLARAVNAGMTKINIATRLNDVFTKTARARLTEFPSTADTRKYLGPAREAVSAEVAHLLTVLGSAG
ncbi:class II fructose-bisphosphate aldolase [Spirillospora sp. CA-142024]|uniref:class II fructose-bisphosphate aldolase n=1 Tax=Spirillospora sp. CA-142024 TaxID=3240036 RepID=UPI003D8DF129